MGVHGDLVLCGVTDETLSVREGDERGCCAVALVVGDNLDAIISEDADTRVCGAQIDADCWRHGVWWGVYGLLGWGYRW